MKLTGIMPFRNEQAFLPLTVRAALMWLDELVLLDHASTDRSPAIALDLAAQYYGRIRILRNMEPVWREMSHRQALLDAARSGGATHIAIVDADELLTANLLGTIRELIDLLAPGQVLQIPWVCLASGYPDRYYAEGVWWNNWVSMAFCDHPNLHWATPADGYDFHHRHPRGDAQIRRVGNQEPRKHSGGLLHLQFLQPRRLCAKQALYKLTEVLRWPDREPVSVVDARYNRAVYESAGAGTAEIPASWVAPYDLSIETEPIWQEKEVARLIAEHGRERFAGLDLFGVDHYCPACKMGDFAAPDEEHSGACEYRRVKLASDGRPAPQTNSDPQG